MSEAQFLEKVPVGKARKYVKDGRKPYQYLTENPHVLPIFGPAYDDRGSLNIAKREGRYAETVEEARVSARRAKTDISEVFFLK